MNITKYYIKDNLFKRGNFRNLDVRNYKGIKLYVPWKIKIMEKETRNLVDIFQGTSLYVDIYYKEGLYQVTDGNKDYLMSEDEINHLCFPCTVIEVDEITQRKNYFDIIYERGSGFFKRKEVYHFNLNKMTPKIKDEFNKTMGIIFKIFEQEDKIAISGLFHGVIDCMERLEDLSKYAKESELLQSILETQEFLLKLFNTIKSIGGIHKNSYLSAKTIINRELIKQRELEKNRQRELIKDIKKEDFSLRIKARNELLEYFDDQNPKIEDI